jgi:sugar/nucleoside kinase (ribokinase family)
MPDGVVRLLNTSAGRTLCLAGNVDDGAVDAFLSRYGHEPARIDRIDAGSVTVLSPPGLELLRQHLAAARGAGRPVTVVVGPAVERLLADDA